MPVRYKVRILNTANTLLFETNDFNALNYSRTINGFGSHTISFHANSMPDPEITLAPDNFIEVHRSDLAAGIAEYLDYSGFHRTLQRTISARGLKLYTSYGRTYEDLLNRRSILYKVTHARATKSGPAETVIKSFVDENAGPNALVSGGRLQDGITPGLVISPDVGTGDTWNGSVSYQNLLDVLRKITEATGVFFWITKDGIIFTFQCSSTFASDRSTQQSVLPPVIFSTGFGNMVNPNFIVSRTEEVNSIIVLGQGQDLARAVEIRDNLTAQGLSPWNKIEKTHDARNSSTVTALQLEGDSELITLAAKDNCSFEVLQTGGSRYGRDYFFGDITTFKFDEREDHNKRLVEASVHVAEGKEKITFQHSDTSTDPDSLRQILMNINSRLRSIEVRQDLSPP